MAGTFGVFGQTPEECRSRIRTVISLCQSRNVEIVKGLADQVFLFHQFLAGNKLGPEKIGFTTPQLRELVKCC